MDHINEILGMVVASVIFIAGVVLLMFLSRSFYRTTSTAADEVIEKQAVIQEQQNINTIGKEEIYSSAAQVFNDILSIDLETDVYLNGSKVSSSVREKAVIEGDTQSIKALKQTVESAGTKFIRNTKHSPSGSMTVYFKKVI